MAKHRIFTTSFATVYPLYVQKAARKGRTNEVMNSSESQIIESKDSSPEGEAAQSCGKLSCLNIFRWMVSSKPPAGQTKIPAVGLRMVGGSRLIPTQSWERSCEGR